MYNIPIVKPAPTPLQQLLGGFKGGLNIANALQQASAARRMQAFQSKMQPLQLQQLQQDIALTKQKGAALDRPKVQSPMGKALSDYQQTVAQYGAASPQAQNLKNYIQKLQSIRQGLAVTGTPQGGFTITEGGLQPPSAPLQPGVQPGPQLGGPVSPQAAAPGVPAGAAGGIMRLPSAPQTRYGTGGTTLYDPKTKQAISVPTQTVTAAMQQALIAGSIITPSLKNIYKDVAPMVGASNLAARTMAQLKRVGGAETPLLDKYEAGLKTATTQTADLLLKEMTLRQTEKNRIDLQKSMSPGPNPTKYSLAMKMATTLSGIAMRDNTYSQFMKGGIPLKKGADKTMLQRALRDKIYNELLASLAPEESPITQQGGQIEIPSFSNKQQFQSWYQNLSPQQQQQAKAQLGK